MAVNKIYVGGEVFGGDSAVRISKEKGNALIEKTDGLYVTEGSVEISEEDGNIIEQKADGLFATCISREEIEENYASKRLSRTLTSSGVEVLAEADLNDLDYLKVNSYSCSYDTRAKDILNCPTKRAFKMEVFNPLSEDLDNESTSNHVYRIQKIIDRTGEEWTRSINSVDKGVFTYGDWVRKLNSTEITSMATENKDYYLRIAATGTNEIKENTDLNSVSMMNVGNYYCDSSSAMSTLLNCPTDIAFTLEVSARDSWSIGKEAIEPWIYRIRTLRDKRGNVWISLANSRYDAGEFICENWKKISTSKDLEAYAKKTDLNNSLNADYTDEDVTIDVALTAWTNEYAPSTGSKNLMGVINSKDGHFHISAYIDANKNAYGTINQWNDGQPNPLNASFNCVGGASTVISPFKGGSKITSGEFISSPDLNGLVEINLGYKPKRVECWFSFSNAPDISLTNQMVSYYDEELSTTQSVWNLLPCELQIYYINLGEHPGESGISHITDTGFKFRSHGENTTNIKVKYIAY